MARIKPFQSVKKTLDILVVDDHQMVRQGLRKMLLSLKSPFLIKTIEAESGEEAIRKMNAQDFDIVFMDYKLPGNPGLDTIYRILRFKPGQKIIGLSNYNELAVIESVLDAGAKGYLLKSIDSTELLKAIDSVLAGKTYYSYDIMLKLLEANERSAVQENLNKKLLTKRETEILQLIVRELRTDEIAAQLSISKRTVETHRQNISNKLHVKTAAGLVKKAIKMKLDG